MKKFMLSMAVVVAIGFTSCSSDDDSSSGGADDDCVTCAAYEAGGFDFPAVEVCEGENGNAFVEDVDTTVPFDTYVSAIEQLTTCE